MAELCQRRKMKMKNLLTYLSANTKLARPLPALENITLEVAEAPKAGPSDRGVLAVHRHYMPRAGKLKGPEHDPAIRCAVNNILRLEAARPSDRRFPRIDQRTPHKARKSTACHNESGFVQKFSIRDTAGAEHGDANDRWMWGFTPTAMSHDAADFRRALLPEAPLGCPAPVPGFKIEFDEEDWDKCKAQKKATEYLKAPRTQSLLSRQLQLFSSESRSLCIEHANRCPTISRVDVTGFYRGYTANVAHQNVRRMKTGPALLSVATRKQFRRLVGILRADGRYLGGCTVLPSRSPSLVELGTEHA
jgi:hypothetical protein